MILLVVVDLVAAAVGATCLVLSGTVAAVIALHGALMMLAWGAVLPLGGIVARYFKVTPGQDFPARVDNPFWWIAHRAFQYSGVLIATVAVGLILSQTGGRFVTLHGRCGLVLMAVTWLQVASPLMRGSKGGPTDSRALADDPATWRGDHYDMTGRRMLFEAWHKPAGWSLIGLGCLTLVLGADLAAAPAWLFGILGLMQASLLLVVIDCRLRGRWVDTWVALWGPVPRPAADPLPVGGREMKRPV